MHAPESDPSHGARPLPAPRTAAAATVLADVLTTLTPELLTAGAVVEYEPLPSFPVDRVVFGTVLRLFVREALVEAGDLRPRLCLRVTTSEVGWRLALQANGTRADRRTGTMRLLATCRPTIERQGGRLWSEEEPDGGVVLYLALPSPGRGTG